MTEETQKIEANKIILGDCIDKLKELPENSIDAIITDPPYGLGFMNKEWDDPNKEKELIQRERERTEQRKKEGISNFSAPFSQSVRPGLAIKGAKENRWFQEWSKEWAEQALRVLKPGGYLLSFCATRMYHRMASGIEDAGFQIRDIIMWIYGSGFPKSFSVPKAIDKLYGAEREVIGSKLTGNPVNWFANMDEKPRGDGIVKITSSTTPEAKRWDGWGTALKPACEPIVMARKPFSEKNVALNVLKWETGGIDIDSSRIPYVSNEDMQNARWGTHADSLVDHKWGMKDMGNNKLASEDGRFPSNVILDKEAGQVLRDESRFFYIAKPSQAEKNYGMDDNTHSTHPTIKPVKLMEYLIKMVTKEEAIVLDPFLGSGTTAVASLRVNRKFIGIEKEEEYLIICKARIKPYLDQKKLSMF